MSGHTPGPWSIDGLALVVAPEPAERGEYKAIAQVRHNARANARLIAASPDFASACGLDLHPGERESCGPLSWLRSAIDTLKEDAVREAGQGDDPDAYWTMINECEHLLNRLQAAISKFIEERLDAGRKSGEAVA